MTQETYNYLTALQRTIIKIIQDEYDNRLPLTRDEIVLLREGIEKYSQAFLSVMDYYYKDYYYIKKN